MNRSEHSTGFKSISAELIDTNRSEKKLGTIVWYGLSTKDNYTVFRAMNRSERSTRFKSISAYLIDINRSKK